MILSNETELIFGVQIREDSIIERTEIFTATLLTTFGTVSRVVLGSLQETIVFIDDNDCELDVTGSGQITVIAIS